MPLKILHVTTVDLSAYCFLRTTMDLLRAEGHQVALACTFERFQSQLAAHADQLFPLQIPRQIRPYEDFRALLQIYRLLRSYRPDVVHSYTSKAGFLVRLAARWARVPVVVHTIYELPQNSTASRGKKAFYWLLEALAARWCQALVTISEVNRRQILAEKICPPQKLSLVRVGLPLERYQVKRSQAELRQQFKLPQQARLLGMAARFEPVKGHSDLLQALALLAPQHPDLHLVLMGSGPLQGEVMALAQALGLEHRVHLLGWVEDLVPALATLDLFVLPSHYEGLGVVLLEALALGIPVVSTRVGGTQDIVEEGVTGLTAPPRQPAELAQALSRCLENPEQAQQWAQAGQQRVRQNYRAQDCDRQILDLYLKLRPESLPSPP